MQRHKIVWFTHRYKRNLKESGPENTQTLTDLTRQDFRSTTLNMPLKGTKETMDKDLNEIEGMMSQ